MEIKNKNNAFQQIKNLVKLIPKGKVTTYGTLAQALGISNSRIIGWAIHGNQDSQIPCHRVVKKDGQLATGFLGGWQLQKKKLLDEGVAFIKDNQVDIKKHFWQP